MEKLHRPDLQVEQDQLPEPARRPAPSGEADGEAAARQSEVQRMAIAQPVVQRAPLPGAQTSAPAWDFHARRAVAESSGAPVDGGIRRAVERRVGSDLSGARVHTGAAAAEAATAVGARAFTYGRDVFVGAGESAQDSRLMAHELTHVVQQEQSAPVVQRDAIAGHSTEPTEEEADRVARDVTKGKPEIEATDKAIGNHVAEGMDEANMGPHTANEGIHYAHNFKRFYPQKWDESMWQGYANPEFFERVGFMDWKLKAGKSASDGIKAWLKGLTIAECLSTVIALQIDALRAAIGDDKFDQRHGMAGGGTPESTRLRIRPGTQGTPVGPLMIETDAAKDGEKAGDIGNRPAHRGEWYYFYNHPKYLLKHPGGAWQGENALCMGDENGTQMWSGLGASGVTEDGMMDEMVRAYNNPRTDRDNEVLGFIKEQHGGKVPKIYDPESGEFPDKITKADILSAPAYTIDGVTRTGGFLSAAGMKLDAEAVAKLRGKE